MVKSLSMEHGKHADREFVRRHLAKKNVRSTELARSIGVPVQHLYNFVSKGYISSENFEKVVEWLVSQGEEGIERSRKAVAAEFTQAAQMERTKIVTGAEYEAAYAKAKADRSDRDNATDAALMALASELESLARYLSLRTLDPNDRMAYAVGRIRLLHTTLEANRERIDASLKGGDEGIIGGKDK